MKGVSSRTISLQIAMGLGLASCHPGGQSPKNDADAAVNSSNAASMNSTHPSELRAEPKSIIRPDVEVGARDVRAPQPESVTIPFPANGTKPDEGGLALIDGLMSSPAFEAGGPITIWGHSDSRGSDRQNMTASRRRAEAVRDYFTDKGVPHDRMTVIALGEGRPVAPNRQLDGTEDEKGQAQNRRVEIRVDLPPLSSEQDVPSPAAK